MVAPPSAADAVQLHVHRKALLTAIVAEVFADITATAFHGPVAPFAAPVSWPSSKWYAGNEDEDLNGGNLALHSTLAYVIYSKLLRTVEVCAATHVVTLLSSMLCCCGGKLAAYTRCVCCRWCRRCCCCYHSIVAGCHTCHLRLSAWTSVDT
jgi:hypothetical protein